MTISAQALDGVYGCSAEGLPARLEYAEDGAWQAIADGETNASGRITDWTGKDLDPGLYRIVFDSDRYFVTLGIRAAYPQILVMIRVRDSTERMSVQVLMSPHTYSACYTAGD